MAPTALDGKNYENAILEGFKAKMEELPLTLEYPSKKNPLDLDRAEVKRWEATESSGLMAKPYRFESDEFKLVKTVKPSMSKEMTPVNPMAGYVLPGKATYGVWVRSRIREYLSPKPGDESPLTASELNSMLKTLESKTKTPFAVYFLYSLTGWDKAAYSFASKNKRMSYALVHGKAVAYSSESVKNYENLFPTEVDPPSLRIPTSQADAQTLPQDAPPAFAPEAQPYAFHPEPQPTTASQDGQPFWASQPQQPASAGEKPNAQPFWAPQGQAPQGVQPAHPPQGTAQPYPQMQQGSQQYAQPQAVQPAYPPQGAPIPQQTQSQGVQPAYPPQAIQQPYPQQAQPPGNQPNNPPQAGQQPYPQQTAPPTYPPQYQAYPPQQQAPPQAYPPQQQVPPQAYPPQQQSPPQTYPPQQQVPPQAYPPQQQSPPQYYQPPQQYAQPPGVQPPQQYAPPQPPMPQLTQLQANWKRDLAYWQHENSRVLVMRVDDLSDYDYGQLLALIIMDKQARTQYLNLAKKWNDGKYFRMHADGKVVEVRSTYIAGLACIAMILNDGHMLLFPASKRYFQPVIDAYKLQAPEVGGPVIQEGAEKVEGSDMVRYFV